MNPPPPNDHPSPTTPGWLLVDPVRPSTACELYSKPNAGAGPAAAATPDIGYDHVNAPDCAEAPHVLDADNDVAPKSPVG